MKRLQVLAVMLLLANFAMADQDLATLTKRGVKAAAHATKVAAVATAKATKNLGKNVGKGSKKLISDGSGPICCPHSGCCWTKPPRPPA